MKRLYLVDFDRSLFDTARFQADLFRAVTGGDQNRQAKFESDIPQYSDPATGFYDFFKHAVAFTGLSHAQLDAQLEAGLRDPDYSFPDARRWVGAPRAAGEQIVILTVGGPDYQNLKFKHAPGLSRLPHHIINANKSALLAKALWGQHRPPYTVKYAPGRFDEIILIDDVATHLQHLPALPGISGIHLVRPDGKYSHIPAPSGIRTITNLGELT
jgi:hypothetical protein